MSLKQGKNWECDLKGNNTRSSPDFSVTIFMQNNWVQYSTYSSKEHKNHGFYMQENWSPYIKDFVKDTVKLISSDKISENTVLIRPSWICYLRISFKKTKWLERHIVEKRLGLNGWFLH